ncbi:hemicentin-1-like isoform X2 [Ruditapes philippinarum]|uniref:hemicentin-1-like isoform X2 n=1 Tax=Ruditapes philippinarum TaxID=129788 RepID=UPI00295BD6B0|nr:hemicentin-1-like isoform X2 [Ruditapes philippinarum]
MQNWKFHFSINALCFIHGVSCQSIVLTPTKPYVDINEALTLTCTYIGYNNVAGTKWNVNNEVSPTTIRHQDNTCSGSGIFADYNIYRVGCPSDTSFTVTILRVQQEDLNISWQCFDRDRTSNTVRILVKVSVANVVLSGPSSRFIKEQSRQTIKCKTSPGRPQPRVSWYLYESNKGVKHKITVNSSTQILNESEDGLVAVESTLQFYPNRSINNWMLNCEAWTDDETRAVHSNILTLNIAYPPQKPVIIEFTDGEKYTVIESELGNLSCSSHGGNPLANLTWNCYNSKPTSVTIEDKSVTSTVTWSGFRGQSSCSCISKHSWSGSMQTTTVMIDVLYKALILKYSVLNSGAHDSVTVGENETVSLQCEIEGNPTPTCEIYNEHNSEMEHQINYSHNYATCFINFKASCLHFGVYKCKGANVINTPGYTEKTINIFVECSPRPSPSVPVRNRVIAEMNSSISLYFTALSYPKPNSVLWSKFDGKAWNYVNESNNIRIYQSNLDFGMTIIRASKADFGEYKLFISNIVGSYTHIFYIEHSMVSSKSDVQGNTGLIIGLTIVVIFLATIISVFGVILYKRRRNLKRPDVDVNNSYLNVSGANTQQKIDDKEYEMIGSNMRDPENKDNGISKSIADMEENNDISATYEKLTDDRKDINQYSQICYMKEKQRGYGKSMSSGKDEQHTELAKNYINMKI